MCYKILKLFVSFICYLILQYTEWKEDPKSKVDKTADNLRKIQKIDFRFRKNKYLNKVSSANFGFSMDFWFYYYWLNLFRKLNRIIHSKKC